VAKKAKTLIKELEDIINSQVFSYYCSHACIFKNVSGCRHKCTIFLLRDFLQYVAIDE